MEAENARYAQPTNCAKKPSQINGDRPKSVLFGGLKAGFELQRLFSAFSVFLDRNFFR
jgi:uncharacterized protein YgiB involved in biofilm formation